jgi:hypothetical protein
MAVKVIDLKAVDRAISAHLGSMARLREKLIATLASLKSTYIANCNSAIKSFNTQKKAIDKERKDRKAKAQQAHYQGMRSSGGSDFQTYQAKLAAIDADCDEKVDKAKEACDQTVTESAEQFSTDSQSAISQYQTDTEDCVGKLATEHP